MSVPEIFFSPTKQTKLHSIWNHLLTEFFWIFSFKEGDEVPVLVNVAVIGTPGEDTVSFRQGREDKKADDHNSK